MAPQKFEIIDLGKTDRIDTPGFYRLPLSKHHGQPCVGPSVTSSVLREYETPGCTLQDIWIYSPWNDERAPRVDTDALREGRAMACLIEGGEALLREQFVVLPEGAPRKPTQQQIEAFLEGRASEAAERSCSFWIRIDSDPRTPLKHDEFETLIAMSEVLMDDPAAAALNGEPEITMAWHDEEHDLWVLSRPDQVDFSGMVSDYKKIHSKGRYFSTWTVDNAISEFNIHMQMALAWEALEKLTGEFPSEVGVVAQCGEFPFHVIPRQIDEDDLIIGQAQNRRARRALSEALKSGHWPGPAEHIGSYQMPKGRRDRLVEELETEGFL